MYVVGQKNVKVTITAINKANRARPFTLGFQFYDIDAEEVESHITGPFGFLEAKGEIQADLFIPELLYPGRKVLITTQDDTDTRHSDIFYVIEREA